MSWVDTKDRNFEGVQLARIRGRFDLLFARIADALEDAYYQHWRVGQVQRVTITRPNGTTVQWLGNTRRTMPAELWTWLGRSGGANDTPITAAEAKRLFDLLHGGIWHLHALFVAQQNTREVEPYPEDEADPPELDDNGAPTGVRASDRARTYLSMLIDLSVDLPALVRGVASTVDVTL